MSFKEVCLYYCLYNFLCWYWHECFLSNFDVGNFFIELQFPMLAECRELHDRECCKTNIFSHALVLLARGSLFYHYLIEVSK